MPMYWTSSRRSTPMSPWTYFGFVAVVLGILIGRQVVASVRENREREQAAKLYTKPIVSHDDPQCTLRSDPSPATLDCKRTDGSYVSQYSASLPMTMDWESWADRDRACLDGTWIVRAPGYDDLPTMSPIHAGYTCDANVIALHRSVPHGPVLEQATP